MISKNAHKTLEHIRTVQTYLGNVCSNLFARAVNHDTSKLKSPEEEIFELYSDKLSPTTYGKEEYNKYLEEMKVALDHHYANNPHHPEYYSDGIKGMSLLDLIEMIVDWKAASERHADGDILRSIDVNQSRFGYSDELKEIFVNTVHELFYKGK